MVCGKGAWGEQGGRRGLLKLHLSLPLLPPGGPNAQLSRRITCGGWGAENARLRPQRPAARSGVAGMTCLWDME